MKQFCCHYLSGDSVDKCYVRCVNSAGSLGPWGREEEFFTVQRHQWTSLLFLFQVMLPKFIFYDLSYLSVFFSCVQTACQNPIFSTSRFKLDFSFGMWTVTNFNKCSKTSFHMVFRRMCLIVNSSQTTDWFSVWAIVALFKPKCRACISTSAAVCCYHYHVATTTRRMRKRCGPVWTESDSV